MADRASTIPLPGNGLPANRERGRVPSGIIFINRKSLRRCRLAQGIWSGEDPLQPLEAAGRQARFRPDDAWPGVGGNGSQGSHDRHERGCAIGPSIPAQVSQSTPRGFVPAVEKGVPDGQRGRLIGRTKGGMNTRLHAVTDADGRPALTLAVQLFSPIEQKHQDDHGAENDLPGELCNLHDGKD